MRLGGWGGVGQGTGGGVRRGGVGKPERARRRVLKRTGRRSRCSRDEGPPEVEQYGAARGADAAETPVPGTPLMPRRRGARGGVRPSLPRSTPQDSLALRAGGFRKVAGGARGDGGGRLDGLRGWVGRVGQLFVASVGGGAGGSWRNSKRSGGQRPPGLRYSGGRRRSRAGQPRQGGRWGSPLLRFSTCHSSASAHATRCARSEEHATGPSRRLSFSDEIRHIIHRSSRSAREMRTRAKNDHEKAAGGQVADGAFATVLPLPAAHGAAGGKQGRFARTQVQWC